MIFEQRHEKHKDEVRILWTDKTDPDEVYKFAHITEGDTYDVTLAISAQDQEVAV